MRTRRIAAAFLLTAIGAACEHDAALIADPECTDESWSKTTTAMPAPVQTSCRFYGFRRHYSTYYPADHAQNSLLELDVQTHAIRKIGEIACERDYFRDAAFRPDGALVGITTTSTYEIDPATAASKRITPMPWVEDQRALEFLPSGKMVVAGRQHAVLISESEAPQVVDLGGFYVNELVVLDENTVLALADVDPDLSFANIFLRLDLAGGPPDIAGVGEEALSAFARACDGRYLGHHTYNPPHLIEVDPVTFDQLHLAPALEPGDDEPFWAFYRFAGPRIP